MSALNTENMGSKFLQNLGTVPYYIEFRINNSLFEKKIKNYTLNQYIHSFEEFLITVR